MPDPATSSGGGQGWASKRIAAGDETCHANQALRLQAPDVLREIRANAYRRGAATDALAPASFVHDIDVPVFLAGAWQDQETGSHFANMIGNFSPDIPMKVTLMNGVHQDSLAPAVLSEWIEFLDFYVAKTDPVGPTRRPRAGHDRPVPSVRAGRVAGTRPLHERARLRVGVACLRSRAEGAGAVRRRGRERRRCPRSRRPRRRSRCRAPPRRRGTWATTARSPIRHPSSAAADRFAYDPSAFPRTMKTIDDGLTPKYGWKPVPAGKARRVRHRAAHRRHRARRHRQRRPVGAGHDARRRLRGDDQRGASGRQGDLRAERLAARPASGRSTRRRPPRSSRCRPTPGPTWRRCRRARRPWCGFRSTPSATRSGPARGSASWCSRPAATGRSGRSPPSSDRAPSPSCARRALRRRSCCRSSAGST